MEPPGGLPRVFEPLASTALALAPTRVVKTEWLAMLATPGMDRARGHPARARRSWNVGPGTLAPGLASFLSARPLLPLPNGKIHVALVLGPGWDSRASEGVLARPCPRLSLLGWVAREGISALCQATSYFHDWETLSDFITAL